MGYLDLWTLQHSPSQSASSSPAVTSGPMSIMTGAAPPGGHANLRKLLLAKLATEAAWKSCSLMRGDPTRLHFGICADFQDDTGVRRLVSLRTTQDIPYDPISNTYTGLWAVTASCKFTDPALPADSLQLEFQFTYDPDSGRLIKTNESWRGDTDANGEIAVTCVHVWKDYMGLTETYRYCTICDTKENNERK